MSAPTPVPATSSTKAVAKSPVDSLKSVMAMPSVQEQFRNALGDNSSLFVASLIDLYAGDSYMQQCQPQAVVMEALKAATLKLPINKGLGFAYIVPYKSKGVALPQFQVGYRGYIQLAMRTGAYRFINADVVRDGELVGLNKLTGEIDLSGVPTSDTVIGYFAYIETLNGFKKCVFWTKDQAENHAKRYSKAFINDRNGTNPWTTNFDAMAIKTMLRNLLSKYGVMSVEMVQAFTSDADERSPETKLADDLATSANYTVIDTSTGEVMQNQQQGAGVEDVPMSTAPEGDSQADAQAGPSF